MVGGFPGWLWVARWWFQIWVFPKIGGKPPKWMVYIGQPYEQMDDFGGYHYFWKHPYFVFSTSTWGNNEKIDEDFSYMGGSTTS